MEGLYLLIPLSAALVLVIIAVFGWALHKGQFEELDSEGARILLDDAAPVNPDQSSSQPACLESRDPKNPRS